MAKRKAMEGSDVSAAHRTAITGPKMLEELREGTYQKAEHLLPKFVALIEETLGYEPQSVAFKIAYKPGSEERPAVITIAGKIAGSTRAAVRYVQLQEPVDEATGEVGTGPLQLCMLID